MFQRRERERERERERGGGEIKIESVCVCGGKQKKNVDRVNAKKGDSVRGVGR